MQYRMIMAASLALGNFAYAAPAPQITAAPVAIARRQEAGGSTVLDAPMTIKAGESFDGGNAVFDRGVSCTGQEEGGDSDAVFILEKGASLSNVHIGPNQIEGVHCNGACTITNVFWDAVCEDAFSIKKQEDGETTTINGGGAKGAEDKVIQHNGGGTVVIKDFEVSDFGKLYRSCGNCDSMPARHVEVSGGSASSGKMLVGINPNMGDTAKISGIQVTDVAKECVTFEGVTDGSEPKEVGTCDSNSAAGSGSGAGNETAPAESAAPATPTDSDESAPAETPAESEEPATTEAPAEGEEGDDQQEEQPEEEQPEEESGDEEENKDEENQDEEQPEEESGDEEESE